MNSDPIKVVGIGGSLRSQSYSYIALECVLRLLRQNGCTTQLLDLRAMRLPFCNGNPHEPWAAFPSVLQMRAAVTHAHAIVLVTPEYHGSVSGVLKNALDLLSAEHFEGKVVGLMSVLGGPPNLNALNDLGTIMRACHAWVMPLQIAVGHVENTFDGDRILDAGLERRFQNFARRLAMSASRISTGDAPVNQPLRLAFEAPRHRAESL
jgi:NAD(P)H-dependent FMN reductase